MKCREMQAAVGAVLSASAGDAERSRVETHLAGCTRCQDAYAELLRLGELVPRLGAGEVPRGFDQRFAAVFAARRAASRAAARSPWVDTVARVVRPGVAAVVVAVGSMAVLCVLVPEQPVGPGAPDLGRLGATLLAGFVLAAMVQGVRQAVDVRILVSLRGRPEGGLE